MTTQQEWDMISLELTIEKLRDTVADLLQLVDDEFYESQIVEDAKEMIGDCE